MNQEKVKTHETETHCAFDELVLVEALIPHPENPNTHPANQVALLAKNIQVRGWRHPIIRSTLSGFIVAGHARLEAAKALDLESVPVNHQSFTDEADELGFVLADNKIAELAELDYEGVQSILKRLEAEGSDLDLTGFLDFEREPLLEGVFRPDDIGDLPGADDRADPIGLTIDQRTVFEQAATKAREETEDPEMSEGRVVELIAADYLAGA